MVQLSEKKYIIKHLSVGSKRKRFKYSKLAATARICGEELNGKKRRHSHSTTKKRQKIIGDGGLWQSTVLPHESNCDAKFRCTKSFLFILVYFLCVYKNCCIQSTLPPRFQWMYVDCGYFERGKIVVILGFYFPCHLLVGSFFK